MIVQKSFEYNDLTFLIIFSVKWLLLHIFVETLIHFISGFFNE